MKQQMNLEQLATELTRQKNAARDYIADTSVVGFNADMTLDIGGSVTGNFPITAIAHGQLAERLEIPTKYYNRMMADAPALLAENANHWLHSSPEKRLVRTLDGKVRAFLSDRFRPIDNFPIAETALQVFQDMGGENVSIESMGLSDAKMTIKVAFPRITGEVAKGDVIQAGVMISNSEVGMGRVMILPFSKRLVCLNGMIHEEFGTKRNHIGRGIGIDDGMAAEFFMDETLLADETAFRLKVRDTIRFVADEVKFQALLNKYRSANERVIQGDPVRAVQTMAQRFALNKSEEGGILNSLVRGGNLSAWGLANAVTDASKACEEYDRATDLERIGGKIIELAATEWSTIALAA